MKETSARGLARTYLNAAIFTAVKMPGEAAAERMPT
jgi:hypothetical protein